MKFNDLRKRFLSINTNDTNPDKAIRRIGTMAARRFKKLKDDGVPGLFQRFNAFPKPTRLGDDDDELWWLSWLGICHWLAANNPDRLPRDFGAAMVEPQGEHVRTHSFSANDWHQRAQDHAAVCKLLDEVIAEEEAAAAGTKSRNKSPGCYGYDSSEFTRLNLPPELDAAIQNMAKALSVASILRVESCNPDPVLRAKRCGDSHVDLHNNKRPDAYRALEPVEGRLIAACTRLRYGQPNFGGRRCACAHRVAMKIIDDTLSVGFTAEEVQQSDNGKDQPKVWELLSKKFAVLHSVDWVGLIERMKAEAVEAKRIVVGTSPMPTQSHSAPGPTVEAGKVQNGAGVDDLVSLDEAAAIVHRSKRTLENYLGKMPAPHVQGMGGKPSLWKWNTLRPWLEREFVPDLPRRFPRNGR